MKKLAVLLPAFLLLTAVSPVGARGDAPRADYDVVVIGAGGGGLAAAARLGLGGLKTLVIEQHTKAGGYMTNFRRGPYTFEVSLHAMDGLDPDKGMNYYQFKELDLLGRVKILRLDPMYRVVYPDFAVNLPADPEQYRAQLKQLFPAESDGIDGLFGLLYSIYDAVWQTLPLMRGDTAAGLRNLALHPQAVPVLVKYSRMSCPDMVRAYIKDERLYAMFTQLSGFGGNAPHEITGLVFAVIWNTYHQGGYHYFTGGSQAVADALSDVIRENGGEIRLGTLVTKILIEDGRAVGVETSDGAVIRSRYVISNANAPDTMLKLAGREHLPADYAARIETGKVGSSIFAVYLGVNRDYRAEFHGVHDIMVSESYDVVEHYRLCREGVPEKIPYVLANYSVVDPGCAPEGKNVITIITLLPYDWNDGWRESESYETYRALKEEVAMILVKRAEALLPGLSSYIEVMEVGSPRTMAHFTLNPGGSIFGWDNTRDQTMFNRLPQETPIENLYLAGAWTRPGGGQSTVMLSGMVAADMVLKLEKRGRSGL